MTQSTLFSVKPAILQYVKNVKNIVHEVNCALYEENIGFLSICRVQMLEVRQVCLIGQEIFLIVT